MSRARRLPAWLLVCVCAAAPASARYALGPGLPWTRSVSGGDTADAIGLDQDRNIWVAGTSHVNVAFGFGRDIDLFAYSHTIAGAVVADIFYDRVYVDQGLLTGNTDEGLPAMTVIPYVITGGAQPLPTSEIYLTFTTQVAGATDLTVMRLDQQGTGTWFHEDLAGGQERAAAAVSVPGSGSPFECGTITSGGVDQLFFVHQNRANNAGSYLPPQGGRVTATYWSGSLTESVTGRAVAADGLGNAWVVAQQGGDVLVMAYTPVTYADGPGAEQRATPMAGYPKRLVTPGVQDEPWAACRDVTGALWVAGESAADAAVWRFGADGSPSPGFPVRFGQGPGAALVGVIPDGDGGVLMTGRRGGELLFIGVDAAGGLRPGFPITASAAPDAVEGRGLTMDSESSIWIAATVIAAPATWGGTVQRIYRYDLQPEPLPVSRGEVKISGPGGAVLNVARGDALTIHALPVEPGEVRVRILTLRGEPVREWTAGSSANRLLTFTWDGRDSAGRPVASGTYAVRVWGGGLKALKRVVVLRRR